MKRTTWASLVGTFLLMVGASAFAAVPAGKETLKIDLLPGKKGAVEIPHAKHNTEFKKKDGSAIVCKDCHHKATDEKSVKKCSDCHVKPGETLKKHDGKEAPALATMKSADKVDTKTVIFHKRCREGCHKEVGKGTSGKKLSSCKTCHPSK